GRLPDVIHRRGPGVVVLRVVFGAERLEHKLGGLETGRDLEVGWNELGHAIDPRSSQCSRGPLSAYRSVCVCSSAVAGRMPLSEPIEVAEVDARAASDDVLARFHAIEVACHEELQPKEPARGVEEVIAFYRFQPTTHTSCHWLADRGSASLYVHGPTAAF